MYTPLPIRRLLALASLLLACSTQTLLAGTPGSAPQRLAQCAQEANTLSLAGDERREFLRACMSGGGTVSQPPPVSSCSQQADAQQLDGAERRAFLQQCHMQASQPAAK